MVILNMKKIPKEFWLEKGDELEVNNQKFRIIKTIMDSVCGSDNVCRSEKILYLEKGFIIKIIGDKIIFGKNIKDKFEEIKLKSIKIK
ncbi:MAG TPA: hypothetical protein VJH20_04725 [Candidatus Nanoarchaeia archaeon]|nr:hypothetical protein [Candidatus Nanoarchaeia archaeon]